MASLKKIYRKTVHIGTPILMCVALVYAALIWMDVGRIEYQTYCKHPEHQDFNHTYDNGFDCDVAVVEYLKRPENRGVTCGCRYTGEL